MHIYIATVTMYTKLICLSSFNGSLFTNQVTNILTEVVPFCKSLCSRMRLDNNMCV